jgi:hypothetical protein
VNIQQSINFIDTKGSDLEKARLHCIVHGTVPQPEVTRSFIGLQREDGGFPYKFVEGNLSTLNETTVALWWMEELGLLASPVAGKAFVYLLAAQAPDGSWDEDPRIAQYDLPPWIQLGDQKTRLYLSAYSSYWLAVGGYTHTSAFRKAIHFLIRNQEASGRFYGYLHTTWITASVMLKAGERYTQLANRAIQALSEKALNDWADSQVAWALDCLSMGGLPESHPFVQRCLDELLTRQKLDGSWASEDGESYAVSATIQVLKVLRRYGMLTGAVGG